MARFRARHWKRPYRSPAHQILSTTSKFGFIPSSFFFLVVLRMKLKIILRFLDFVDIVWPVLLSHAIFLCIGISLGREEKLTVLTDFGLFIAPHAAGMISPTSIGYMLPAGWTRSHWAHDKSAAFVRVLLLVFDRLFQPAIFKEVGSSAVFNTPSACVSVP